MHLDLTREQAEDLEALLSVSLSELSHEIAATDNAEYRAGLVARRERLHAVMEATAHLLVPASALPDTLLRELARPGGG